MADNSRRGWWQFSLRKVFWLMLLIAVALTAHRRGYNSGFSIGFDSGVSDGLNRRQVVGDAYTKVYDVADLLSDAPTDETPATAANNFVRDVRTNVLPSTWVENGGHAAISLFADKFMLVVSHDQDGQERVAEFLAQCRDKNRKLLTSTK